MRRCFWVPATLMLGCFLPLTSLSFLLPHFGSTSGRDPTRRLSPRSRRYRARPRGFAGRPTRYVAFCAPPPLGRGGARKKLPQRRGVPPPPFC